MDMLGSLSSARRPTSTRSWSCTEQKVDQLFVDVPGELDPALFTVFARVKNERGRACTCAIRSCATFARARGRRSCRPIGWPRRSRSTAIRSPADHRQHRAGRRRGLALRALQALVPDGQQLLSHARLADAGGPVRPRRAKYFIDAGLIVTTLSNDPLPPAIEKAPSLARSLRHDAAAGARGARGSRWLLRSPPAGARPGRSCCRSPRLPQLNVKLLFTAGSAHDPAGKEGLAALTAAMVTERRLEGADASSRSTRAVSDGGLLRRAERQGDDDVHGRRPPRQLADVSRPSCCRSCSSPGWRAEDFERLKTRQSTRSCRTCARTTRRSSARSGCRPTSSAARPTGTSRSARSPGFDAITLDDVKAFAQQMYTRANLTVGVSGDAPDELIRELQARLRSAAGGTGGAAREDRARRGRRASRSRSSRRTRAPPPSRSGSRST